MTAATLRWFYVPGSVVWNSYYRRYELVSDFRKIEGCDNPHHGWYAKVVPCTENGIPNGRIYKHCRQPTQDCFDGTAFRIHKGKRPLQLPLNGEGGMILPETGLTPSVGHPDAI